jgi:hypothetical protein
MIIPGRSLRRCAAIVFAAATQSMGAQATLRAGTQVRIVSRQPNDTDAHPTKVAVRVLSLTSVSPDTLFLADSAHGLKVAVARLNVLHLDTLGTHGNPAASALKGGLAGVAIVGAIVYLTILHDRAPGAHCGDMCGGGILLLVPGTIIGALVGTAVGYHMGSNAWHAVANPRAVEVSWHRTVDALNSTVALSVSAHSRRTTWR